MECTFKVRDMVSKPDFRVWEGEFGKREVGSKFEIQGRGNKIWGPHRGL